MRQRKVMFRPIVPDEFLWRKILDKVGIIAKPILVPRRANMTVAQCYTNARYVSLAHGGRAVSGFLLLVWPNHFAEALHHAVWEDPDGNLIDVTGPAYAGMEKFDNCWFIPDGQEVGDDDIPTLSKFIQLTDNPPVRQWINARNEKSVLHQKLLNIPHQIVRRNNGQKGISIHSTEPRYKEGQEIAQKMADADARVSHFWSLLAASPQPKRTKNRHPQWNLVNRPT